MQVKFYGVRGSIASASPDTVKYGGNTSCVGVRVAGQQIIFDAGTGIRQLGTELGPVGVDAHVFFSHLHWDHIQGFPFFTPAFVPGNNLSMHGVLPSDAVVTDGSPLREALSSQMTAPNFPVGLDMMQANLRFDDVPLGERIDLGRVEVRHVSVDHPNGCVAWRVDFGGKSVVYATDHEHESDELNAGLVDLAQGADLLIYDAMYTPEEYTGEVGMSRVGWGHSTFLAGADIAEAANVKSLCLFHHDPSHDDTFMDGLAERSRKRFSNTVVAQEGLELSL